jgi:hypothetical protein
LSSDDIPSFIDPDRFEETIFVRQTLPFNFAAGTIDEVAAAVPEPAALTLFGAALLAFVALTRRWRRKPEPPFIAD